MKPRNLVLSLSLALAAAPAAPEIVERVIARVNGDIVTLSEFESRQAAAVQGARVGPDEVESFLRQHNTRILQDAIDELLLYQRGQDMGIRMRPEYIAEVVEGIKKDNNIENEAAFQEQLRREGLTLDELKRNIERSIVRRQVLSQEVESKLGITEAAARAEYDAHLADYAEPASVHLLEARLPAGAAGADEIVRRARAGEDLLEIARGAGAAGSDLGRLRRGDLSPDVEKAVFALAPGAVSDPVTTERGISVFKVTERTEGRQVPFAEVKDAIGRRLADTRGRDAYERYLEGLRKAAVIEIRVREVPLQVAPAAAAPAGGRGTSLVPPSGDSEFSTTPQAAPERVAPPPLPNAVPTPAPSPSASPSAP